MPVAPPVAFDDETVAWAYAPPSHLEGEPSVQIPDQPPGPEIAPNQPVRLPSGVVAYRETYGHRERMMELDQQAAVARQASQEAMQNAQMLDQMSRVARSTKDIEIARHAIDVMGLQRDIQGGMPIHEAVARHPMALGAGYGAALKNTAPATPIMPPTRGTVPGVGDYLVDAAGKPHFVPRPPQQRVADLPPRARTGQPVTDASGNVIGTDVGGGRVMPAPKEGSLTDVQQSALHAIDMEAHEKRMSLDKISRQDSQEAIDLKLQIGELRIKRQRVLNAAGTKVPTVSRPTSKPVAVLGQGTREDPARPETKEQMDSVPSKAFYINPKDGKLYQKK